MTLQDLFNDMTYGDLSNVFLGGFIAGEAESEPDPTKYAQLISAINLGLNQLYKEFFLRSEEHYIQLREEISIYKLAIAYAQTNTASAIPIGDRYIMDTVDNPFLDNVLKIEVVFDEEGVQIPLNDRTEDLSIFTPTYRSIQVPYPNNDITYAVQFRAGHPKILYTGVAFDPEAVELELPNSLYEPLLYYVASRVLRPLGGERVIEADNYFQLYRNGVQLVKDEGLEIQGEPGDWRFDSKGWI